MTLGWTGRETDGAASAYEGPRAGREVDGVAAANANGAANGRSR
ncbi:MAG: hypothetical protein NTY63_03885 [Candidatus Bipolaricaulota bacterium]|nr:hypothetical protein [Candidatus Bipolaricaulota bacterium]